MLVINQDTIFHSALVKCNEEVKMACINPDTASVKQGKFVLLGVQILDHGHNNDNEGHREDLAARADE